MSWGNEANGVGWAVQWYRSLTSSCRVREDTPRQLRVDEELWTGRLSHMAHTMKRAHRQQRRRGKRSRNRDCREQKQWTKPSYSLDQARSFLLMSICDFRLIFSENVCCACQTWGWNWQGRWVPDLGSGPSSLRALLGNTYHRYCVQLATWVSEVLWLLPVIYTTCVALTMMSFYSIFFYFFYFELDIVCFIRSFSCWYYAVTSVSVSAATCSAYDMYFNTNVGWSHLFICVQGVRFVSVMVCFIFWLYFVLPPDVIFRSRFIGACLATTDCVVAMS